MAQRKVGARQLVHAVLGWKPIQGQVAVLDKVAVRVPVNRNVGGLAVDLRRAKRGAFLTKHESKSELIRNELIASHSFLSQGSLPHLRIHNFELLAVARILSFLENFNCRLGGVERLRLGLVGPDVVVDLGGRVVGLLNGGIPTLTTGISHFVHSLQPAEGREGVCEPLFVNVLVEELGEVGVQVGCNVGLEVFGIEGFLADIELGGRGGGGVF